MQTAKRLCSDMFLINVSLDLQISSSDAMSFVPMQLRTPAATIAVHPHGRNALKFTPSSVTVGFNESSKITDTSAHRDDFNRDDLGEKVKVLLHDQTVAHHK